jgi:predicted ATP-binding protein involved in virulence
MNYWHMQLHPYQNDWNKEKELLESLSIIGLGIVGNNYNNTQNRQFIQDMEIGDIVLIKHGKKVISLVEVMGESKDKLENNYNNLDWFRYRRKVKILDYAKDNISSFPQPRGALQKSINKKTASYQYIHNWYTKVLQKDYNKEDLKKGTYKLKEFYIDNHKMFKNLKLDFTSDNKNPLPIIVIAGKNGIGKTTLLEYINTYSKNQDDYIEIFKADPKLSIFKIIEGMKGIKSKKDEYQNHIFYMPVEINKIDSVEEAIVNYHINIGVAKDLRPSEIITELQSFMDNIFDKDFNLSFTISRIDVQTRQVFFKNNKGIEIAINELSTGEKTLLSKLLYLYFKDVKNQIILIDEPELSLHPAWQNRVLKLYEKFAEKNNCQIIIATHSPHIIGSAKNEWIRMLTEDGVIDNFSKSYGLEFSKVLTDIMGVNNLRTPAVEEDFRFIKKEIYSNNYKDNPQFEKVWKHLEENLESNNIDLDALRHDFELMKKMIFTYKNRGTEEFETVWKRLEQNLGKSDLDLKLLRVEMKMRDR